MSSPLAYRTNNKALGANNALLVSLIASFILHSFFLELSAPVTHEIVRTVVPALDQVRIPIEFIPQSNMLVTQTYTSGANKSVQQMIDAANNKDEKNSMPRRSDAMYSPNLTSTATESYLLAIREEIERNKFDNAQPSLNQIAGNVNVGFTISASGSFSNISIIESSGNPLLDTNAVLAIQKSSSETKRPANTGVSTIKTSAVIKYQYGL